MQVSPARTERQARDASLRDCPQGRGKAVEFVGTSKRQSALKLHHPPELRTISCANRESELQWTPGFPQ